MAPPCASSLLHLLLLRLALLAFILPFAIVSCPSGFPLDASPTASGYLTANHSSGSRMFFVYYEAQETHRSNDSHSGARFHDDDEVPILLWLQGGPGCSSMIGNFYELGPWRAGEDGCLHPNPFPWNRIFGLLFLDNPVGAGFSVAASLEDIPTEQERVAHDIYSALESFYGRFPTFRNRPFYITGESYAGKYIPSVATYILHRQDQKMDSPGFSSLALRLDGVAIGNGLTHPIVQVQLNAPIGYYMGLMDEHQTAEAGILASKVVALIEKENWEDAHSARNDLLDYIKNVTGLATLLDVRRQVDYYEDKDGVDYLSAFMNNEEMQASLLEIGPLSWEPCNNTVRKRMASDVPKSVKHLVEELLNQSIPVLLYQGQFDLQDGVATVEAWMEQLQWDGLDGFYASKRSIWKTDNNIVLGYVRSYSSLTHVVVSNAGHLVPADQAYSSQRMIEGWVSNRRIT